MRNTAIELEPELTANNRVPSLFTIRFWSESNGPSANVLSKTPFPPAGVLPRKVGLPLPSFLKVRMEFPAVLLLSSQIRSVTPALQAGACVAPSIANPTNKMANGRHLTTWKERGSNANVKRHLPLPSDCRCARR